MRTYKNNKGVVEKEHSYNLTELIQVSNGSNDFVANMIEIFIKSSSEIITRIKVALENGDWKQISALAHKAIPSFHFIGLKLFAEKLKFIELNALNKKDQKRMAEMIGLITKNMAVILEELQGELPKFRK
ncbi:MAG: Hpt domain-containing protein [Bacteroidetes bacterium]|nr:Hpt domain-containing protein [Bacteroidota bacterium]